MSWLCQVHASPGERRHGDDRHRGDLHAPPGERPPDGGAIEPAMQPAMAVGAGQLRRWQRIRGGHGG